MGTGHSKQDNVLQLVPKYHEINIPSVLAAGDGALTPLLGRWEAGQREDCRSGSSQMPPRRCCRKPPTAQPHPWLSPEPCSPRGPHRTGGSYRARAARASLNWDSYSLRPSFDTGSKARRGGGVALVRGSARWAFTGCLDRSASNASSSGCERRKAGLWVSCLVSFKANFILYIKVVFLLKNVKNGPGRSEWLFPGGDRRDESLLQKAVSTPSPATAIHKLKNKSITRVNELKMSVFKMYQGKNC